MCRADQLLLFRWKGRGELDVLVQRGGNRYDDFASAKNGTGDCFNNGTVGCLCDASHRAVEMDAVWF